MAIATAAPNICARLPRFWCLICTKWPRIGKPGGPAAKVLTDNPKAGLTAILTGMGSLSYGELAGERMKLGLLLHDPEEEHDCFSDNTFNSHYYDMVGIMTGYTGELYPR